MAEQNTDEKDKQAQEAPVDMTVKETGAGVIVETQKQDMSISEPEADQNPAIQQPETPTDGTQDLEQDFQKQQAAEQEVKSELAKNGIDFDALAAEYDADGALSAKSLEALEKAGYPKAVVDAYIAGLDAMADRYVQKVKQMAGGEDAYAQLVQYISAQPQSVIDGFNAALQTGNLAQIQLAINGLRAQMTQQFGTNNPSVMAGQTGAGTPSGYRTTAEMTKDMSDPRYQNDPAFTQEVYRKLQNSSLF